MPPRPAPSVAPSRIVAESEKQWLFTEAELANTPSIQDGMTQKEEVEIRTKAISFINQVAILLRIPQLTITTAAIFFQRFLMRASLKQSRGPIPKLHHFQSAATALFLATKVEESCRKMRELVQACCRVAQKNNSLIVDEQSKDFWRWRDCILDNEDVLLEALCFDLTIDSPHRQMYEMLKDYKIQHHKQLRNAAWAFVTDSVNTQLCLLVSSRTIATAALYAGCQISSIALPDIDGQPWWTKQRVKLSDIRLAIVYVTAYYTEFAGKLPSQELSQENGDEGGASFYNNITAPAADENEDATRLKATQNGSGSKRASPFDGDLNDDHKRLRTDKDLDMKEADGRDSTASHDLKLREERLRVQEGNAQSLANVKAADAEEGSEEGELEE